MTKLKSILSAIALAGVAAASFISCQQSEKHADFAQRSPSSLASEPPRLMYMTYKEGKAVPEEFTMERWSQALSAGGREDYLLKMYYASTKEKSNSGLRHAACFWGSGQEIAKTFFEPRSASFEVRNVEGGQVDVKSSSDGLMLGFLMQHSDKGALSFRLSHCNAGKSTFSETISDQIPKRNGNRQTASEEGVKAEASLKVDANKGFQILDQVSENKSNLPTFQLRGDFHKAAAEKKLPWSGLDLRDSKQALKFLLMVQKYFYENMANQDPKNPDMNFIAAKNKSRYWCHMPWLNVGNTGREAVHGLTKERDIFPSVMYPNPGTGTDWGIGYFNANGCRTVGKVFGSTDKPKATPDFLQGASFEDGTVIAKILFTTAPAPEFKNAFTWHANVSDVGSTNRQIKEVRHIQMDIAVKDESLKGLASGVTWVMGGFYYDPDYDFDTELKDVLGEENPLKSIPNLPKAFFKMRPMGVQTGFDHPKTLDTITFGQAKTNGLEGRLNGPADNPKSSCLGCHGTAGFATGMIPGFTSQDMFKPFAKSTGLDYNQQLAFAKRNYETEMTPKEKK